LNLRNSPLELNDDGFWSLDI